MKKIPTVFQRDEHDRAHVTREPNPAAAWVLAGEGTPTRKYDGTSVLIRNGIAYKRYELKPGKKAPAGFEPADTVDPNTGKQPGWVRIDEDDPNDRWHREALWAETSHGGHLLIPDGTYELIGPKVQGNPEHADSHQLVSHDRAEVVDAPRDFDGLRNWLLAHEFEGVVWHHPDGRMAKLKRRDFT